VLTGAVEGPALPASDGISVLSSGPQAGHYLVWQGRPRLLIGDSVTQGWMESGEDFDQNAYVDALAAHGINLLMLWAYKGTTAELQRRDARLGYDAPERWPWAGSPDDRTVDLQRFTPAYFAALRELVTRAEAKGIVVLITVHDGWTKTCFEGHPFNAALGNGPLQDRRDYVALGDYAHEMSEAFQPAWSGPEQNQFFQERFCARLIAALAPCSNVLYEMFNEGEWYDRTQRRRHEQHFLSFFRARCRNPLLSNSDHIREDSPHEDPSLDVVSLHPQGWTGHFATFQAGFRALPPKPYLYSEPVPEFDGQTPPLETLRRSVWETALAGAGWVNQNDTSFGWNRRAAMAARAAIREEAYAAAGHCARFVNSGQVRFWEMAPHGELASTGVCLAHPGAEYVVYTAAGGRFTVDLSAARGTALQGEWYNPRTGETTGGLAVAGGDAAAPFVPPFDGDAVLHLVSARGPAAP